MRLSIGDSIFYTAHKSNAIGTLTNQMGSSVGTPEQIGKQAVGVVTEKEATELRIDNGNNLLQPDGRYTVIVRYHCIQTRPSPDSDFEHIYNVLDTPEKLDLNYDQYEPPWISTCEQNKISQIGKEIAEMDFNSNDFTKERRDKILTNLDYVQHRASCEVACQNSIFGEYSRSVAF